MGEHCPFLETGHRGEPCCGIGLNFRAVESNCQLCLGCPVPVMLPDHRCQFLEFCTVLRVGGERSQFVEALLACVLKRSRLDDLAECRACPSFVEGELLAPTVRTHMKVRRSSMQ